MINPNPAAPLTDPATLKRLRRIAREAQNTYVGRHWPTMEAMRRDGIGHGLVEDRDHERFIRRFLDTFQPEFVVDLIDALAARATSTPAGHECPYSGCGESFASEDALVEHITEHMDQDSAPTEPCPTCWQPVPVPQRGDHDYGMPLRATSTPAGLYDDYAHHEFRQGGYLTVPLPNDECVWRVDHGPYCGATRADHDSILAKRRAGAWRWPAPPSKEPTDD